MGRTLGRRTGLVDNFGAGAGIVNGFGPGPVAAAAPTSVTYQGKELGGFSAVNKINGALGETVTVKKDSTIWLVFDSKGATAASAENVFSCGVWGVKGFFVLRSGADAGALANRIYLYVPPNIVALDAPPFRGHSIIGIAWRADGSIHMCVNGGPVTTPAAIAVDNIANNTCTTRLGSPDAVNGLTSANLGDVCTWTRAATDDELRRLTYTAANRFQLGAGITNAAAPDNAPVGFKFSVAGDYNAAGFTASGIHFTVSGAPTVYDVEETRFTDPYWLAGTQTPKTDANGNAYVDRAGQAFLMFDSRAALYAVEIDSQMANSFPDQSGFGEWVDGAWVAAETAQQENWPRTAVVYAGAERIAPAAPRRIQAGDGIVILKDAYTSSRLGNGTIAVRVPTKLASGAPSDLAIIEPTTPATQYAWRADSLPTFYATPEPVWKGNAVQLVRDAGRSVVSLSRGSDSMWNLVNRVGIAADVAEVKRALGKSARRVYIFGLGGYNDFVLELWSAASYGAAVSDYFDAFHTACPTAEIQVYTALTRFPPLSNGPNAFGNMLQDYRDAEVAACSGRAYVTSIITGTGIGLVAGDTVAGGHLAFTGMQKLANALLALP